MWLEAFNGRQRRRYLYFIWCCGCGLMIAVLVAQSLEIKNKAERTRLNVLKQTFYKSASALRQQWELAGKPPRLDLAGIQVEFTALGWPITATDGAVDCQKMWDLLASRQRSVALLQLEKIQESSPYGYNACRYQISSGNWLELYFKNERILINGFLTDQASFL